MSAATGVPRAAAIYLGVVQFLFATTWTLYVIYLPALVENAGIAKHWVPWILVADQVIMAVMDVITGFWVDRVRAGLARLGGWILALSAVSCVAFVAMPYAGASATMLLGLILIWGLTSSALRAPPWALLSRYAATPGVPWLSTLVLTGTALAAGLAPFLGIALRDVDPRLPFALSTLTLLITVGGLVFVERRLAAAAPAPAGELEPVYDLSTPQAKRDVALYFIALLLMAASYQVHFSLNSPELFLFYADASQLQYLMPVFWIGFNIMMFPAAGFVKRFGAFAVMAAGSAVGAVATYATMIAPGLDGLVAAQFIAGGCWGAVSVGAFTAAISFGRASREGAFLGALFATLAIASFLRIGAYTGDIETSPAIGKLLAWGPSWGWLLAALLLIVAMVGTRRRPV
ncbi:MAG: MFS transporter [Betaproteobacteria bacterium]|nr:MFS transporter [Betaproteobacteria bacterium]